MKILASDLYERRHHISLGEHYPSGRRPVVMNEDTAGEPTAFDEPDLIRTKGRGGFQKLERFALKSVGNEKVYKLREILYTFDPVHLTMFMLGVCGRKIMVELNTFDFPDGERRVGIKFVEILKMDEW